jgi:guanine deaminase
MLTQAEAYYLATLGGARVLGIDDEIGSFDVGKYFDALLVDYRTGELIDLWDGDLQNDSERCDLAGDDRNIREVWVRGNRIQGPIDQPTT